MGSSAAATCMSARVTRAAGDGACVFYDGQCHPFSLVEGWHAPAGRRTCESQASSPGRADQTGTPVGAIKTWDPADESLAGQPERASADSEVRPGPRPPTLRPYSVKIGEAGPEALSTSSLPTRHSLPAAPFN